MQDDAQPVGALAGVVGRQHVFAAADQEPRSVDWEAAAAAGRWRW